MSCNGVDIAGPLGRRVHPGLFIDIDDPANGRVDVRQRRRGDRADSRRLSLHGFPSPVWAVGPRRLWRFALVVMPQGVIHWRHRLLRAHCERAGALGRISAGMGDGYKNY